MSESRSGRNASLVLWTLPGLSDDRNVIALHEVLLRVS